MRIPFIFSFAVFFFLNPLIARCETLDRESQLKVNKAIDKGVKYLREIQSEDGTWNHYRKLGATALAAWTLLESEVPPTDPAIQKAAKYIRKQSLVCDYNYEICLALIFLSKLGDPQDIPLIESMAFRLLKSQNKLGGWGYNLYRPSASEKTRLTQIINNRKPTKPLGIKSGITQNSAELSPEIRKNLINFFQRPPAKWSHPGDNSNTQFSMLALWVSRRYGIPVDRAIVDVAHRFRISQLPDGSWTYQYSPPGKPNLYHNTPAMTACGLIGLALGHGVNPQGEKTLLEKNPQVQAGLAKLAKFLEKDDLESEFHKKRYYFLWTMERMAVIYGMKKIGDVDWYRWGVDLLLKHQSDDGSWRGEYEKAGCDTCFSLLFLKRVNLAEDLTKKIKGGRIPVFIPDKKKKKKAGRIPILEDPKKKTNKKSKIPLIKPDSKKKGDAKKKDGAKPKPKIPLIEGKEYFPFLGGHPKLFCQEVLRLTRESRRKV